LTIFFALAAALWTGCGKQRSAPGTAQLHVAVPPHGGTPMALGDAFRIEWVLDAAAGKLQAYIMDDDMENFVRIAPTSFDVTAKLPGHEETLHFEAVPNTATGETVGNTSLFEAQADWLKTTKSFDAVIREINVKGTIFTQVAFNFP
jgi:hypothetical protein